MTATKRLTTYSANEKARKLFGKNGYAEYRANALTADEKAAIRPRREELRNAVKAWEAVKERDRVAMGLVEYDARVEAYREARKELRELEGQALGYRCTVGVIDRIPGICGVCLVRGQGDTWEEAFEKAGK